MTNTPIPIPPEVTSEHQRIETGSLSSQVFRSGDYVFKLTRRNPVERAAEDYRKILERLGAFAGRIVPSSFGETRLDGEVYTVVAQPHVSRGRTVAEFCRAHGGFDWLFTNPLNGNENARFVAALGDWLLESSSRDELYPDPVGWPIEPFIKNSINLLVEPEGLVVLCDVGLSPHADTLARHGVSFYRTPGVIHYRRATEIDVGHIRRLAQL